MSKKALMIINSNQALFGKMLGCELQEVIRRSLTIIL
jgi:hypothetical protein